MTEQHTSHRPDDDLDFDAVLTRHRAMVEAGTHPMIADRLARNAARNQMLRERQIKLAASVVREPVAASVPVVVPEAVPVGAVEERPDLRA